MSTCVPLGGSNLGRHFQQMRSWDLSKRAQNVQVSRRARCPLECASIVVSLTLPAFPSLIGLSFLHLPLLPFHLSLPTLILFPQLRWHANSH